MGIYYNVGALNLNISEVEKGNNFSHYFPEYILRKKDTLAKSLVYWKWLFLFNKVSYLLIKQKKKTKKTLNNLQWFLLFQLCFLVGGKQILMVIYWVAGLQGNRCHACVPNRRHRWDCQPFYPARWGLKAYIFLNL